MKKLPKFKTDQVLFDGATEHERYLVVDTKYNNRPARILYTNNRTAAQSGLAFDNNPELLFDYNERFMEIIRGVRPNKLLLIGGGAFTLPMAINRQFPNIKLDVFEIDSGLLSVASQYFGLQENAQLKVYIGDGRALLRQAHSKYDLIILDVFNSIDIPDDFREPELAKELKNRLNPRGLVAMNVIAAYYGQKVNILKTLTENFEASLSKTEIFPAGGALSLWASQNFIVVAGETAPSIAKHLRYKPVRDL